MADMNQLYTALRNADAAGDVDAARKIASHIKLMQSQQNAPVPERSIADTAIQTAGNLFGGALRGAGSIGSTLLAADDATSSLSPINLVRKAVTNSIQGKPALSNALDIAGVMGRDRARRAGMDEGLQEFGLDPNSKSYRLGKLGGEVAGTAGAGGLVANAGRAVLPAALSTKALPFLTAVESGGMSAGGAGMLTRVLGGATNGAVSSAMVNPEDTMTGAAIGGVLPPSLRMLGAAGSKLRNLVTAGGANQDLAKTAINQYGIPLGLGDATSSPVLKATQSILNDSPLIGGVGAKHREAVQAGFNKAVGQTFGADATKLTPEVLDAAKARMGSEFDRIWNRNVLQVDGDFMNKMMSLSRQAEKLPKNEAQSLKAELNDLYSKIVTDEAGNPVIAGDIANKFQSYLRRRAESSSGLKNELSDLRQNILSTFNRGVAPADAAALTLNRSQYKAFKTVEPLLNKGEVGVAGREAGDIPAALLPSAVAQNYSRAAGTPLADLSKIGSKFLVDRVARTGGSTRAMLQNSALGAALGTGAMSNPALLGVLPAGYGLNMMLSNPELAKRMINSQMGLLGGVSPELMQFGYQVAPVALNNR